MSKKADKQSLPSDEGKVQELENKVNELEAQLKRAVADYHNLEKRVSEGRSELTNYVGAEIIRKVLPALDHLEQAISGVSTSAQSANQNGWVRGVELAVKELKNVLQTEGLEEIQTEGEFNPSLQEAVDTEVGEDNKIVRVVRKGYTLNGKVLRPAQVVVGKKNSPSMEETKDIPGGETQSDFHIPPEEEK